MRAGSAATTVGLFLSSLHPFCRPVQSLTMSTSSSTTSAAPRIRVKDAGHLAVCGIYNPQSPFKIPSGFDRTCREMRWDTERMWERLAQPSSKVPWFEHATGSYIYFNHGDGRWWIDGPSGAGVYIVESGSGLPTGKGWTSLSGEYDPVPQVEEVDNEEEYES